MTIESENRSPDTRAILPGLGYSSDEMVRWPRLAAGVVGLGWYLYLGGARTINPLNADWLSGDWLQHWTGFLFFKQEAWTFPLGKLTSLPYPIGTSIGFTDSNPLVAFALKPFAPLLP